MYVYAARSVKRDARRCWTKKVHANENPAVGAGLGDPIDGAELVVPGVRSRLDLVGV